MPRWEGDGRERLEQAALDLFLEIGYEATTVAAIARRAGLTERSFYRHFSDKREVLFARDSILIDHLASNLSQQLRDHDPYTALLEAFVTAEEVFLPRDALQRRVDAITGSIALSERERTKLTALSNGIAAVLTEHGMSSRNARLLSDLGMSVFLAASDDRITDPAPFRALVYAAADAQQRLLPSDGTTPLPAKDLPAFLPQ
jgi:AcrR family transcriptional regulator